MSFLAEMPGAWICDKCGFILQKNVLHAGDGAVSADVSPLNELCPNDGKLMRPYTWKEANDAFYRQNNKLQIELCDARMKLTRLQQMHEALNRAHEQLLHVTIRRDLCGPESWETCRVCIDVDPTIALNPHEGEAFETIWKLVMEQLRAALDNALKDRR